MNVLTKTLAAGALLTASPLAAADNPEIGAIHQVLKAYERALVAADTDAVLSLYADDGVFMPQHSPSQVGALAVRAAYDHVFATIKLDISFEIVEIVPVAADWAFARTNSTGFVTVRANGQRVAESNQELFLLHKVSGTWKIARYAFSTTNPPRG